MIFKDYKRVSCRWFAVAVVGMLAAEAYAGPGFVDNARVLVDEPGATIEVRFNCKTEYLRHEPQGSGDYLRIFLDPTSICNGVSPLVADTRSLLRPANADAARLIDLEYEGDSAAGPVLTLRFSETVNFAVDMSSVAFKLVVPVQIAASATAESISAPDVAHRRVVQPQLATPDYVINLVSLQRAPTILDAADLQPAANQRLSYTKVDINGVAWFRLQLGVFASAEDAAVALNNVQSGFPGAWIDTLDADDISHELLGSSEQEPPAQASLAASPGATKVDALMDEGRKMMVTGDVSRAIQIYTKVLQLPASPRHPEAQEYLALAREKKGQMAHAKAEYERYLSLYPGGEGAARVSQRLAAINATGRRASGSGDVNASAGGILRAEPSPWRVQTYISQYYRRDANQLNDDDEIVSQSALYSDVNLDARRRGERFDFSSRLSAGYRNDFLDEGTGSGNQTRVSYAYADVADAVTGLRARIGRQSRNTGGVLGRFDGVNLRYQASERIAVDAVYGMPAYSATDGIDSERSFFGASVNYGPILGDLELGLYIVQQEIEGIDDRQAIGTEFRYFGENQSLWGLVDYDTLYGELGSAFVQGSWRFANRLSLYGSYDRRHSPFLSAGNALIGQPVATFAELLEIYPEEDIRQFSVDRSPLSTTFTLGLSHSLSPKLQINADINQTDVAATPESGGVFETPATTFRYFATSLVASSLIKEGDVSIFGVRYSESDTTTVMTLTMDSRYPFGRAWRINPRLRVDRRESQAEMNDEWVFTPGIRVQYRRSQRFRIEFEAGKQFAQRESVVADTDRESFFVNLGYQVFF